MAVIRKLHSAFSYTAIKNEWRTRHVKFDMKGYKYTYKLCKETLFNDVNNNNNS
jgi:hypothetical protein